MMVDPRLHQIAAAQPYPLLFATISGAHLYGFHSPDSDYDLRGVHLLPLEKVVGLEVKHETLEDSRIIDGLEMDIVTHDVKKFFRLLFIPDLVARKIAGPEQSRLADADLAFYEAEYQRVRGQLQSAHEASSLPELPSEETRRALNDLLTRIRIKGLRGGFSPLSLAEKGGHGEVNKPLKAKRH